MFPGPPCSPFSARVISNTAQPCRACHHRSGSTSGTAIAAPTSRGRSATVRRAGPSRVAASGTAPNIAARWLNSAPTPTSAPTASHHRVSPVRPIRTTTSAIAAHASISYGVVLATCPPQQHGHGAGRDRRERLGPPRTAELPRRPVRATAAGPTPRPRTGPARPWPAAAPAAAGPSGPRGVKRFPPAFPGAAPPAPPRYRSRRFFSPARNVHRGTSTDRRHGSDHGGTVSETRARPGPFAARGDTR